MYSEWFKGGRTNMSYNCLDRHVAAEHGDQTCFLFEGNEPGRDGAMTYKQVLDEVCRVVSGWVGRMQGGAEGGDGRGARRGQAGCLGRSCACTSL